MIKQYSRTVEAVERERERERESYTLVNKGLLSEQKNIDLKEIVMLFLYLF